MFRRQREEKAIFGQGGTATRYRMRQNLVAIGDDFAIENEAGQKVYKVDGKVLRIRDTLHFKDMEGKLLCRIKERLIAITDSMTIEDGQGKDLASIHKALISPLVDRYSVKVKDGPDLHITGNLLDYEYDIKDGRDKVAEISKKWFRITDTYGVEIAPGQNEILILAITVAVDMLEHKQKNRRHKEKDRRQGDTQ
ncbi:MAG: LURP-one-related family protein [Anaerolineaceae bacterium]|nr:LURP-one-related family protein [Anaerolineaceae bacterium]